MLNVSEQYNENILSDDRQFLLKAEFCQLITGGAPDEQGVLPVEIVETVTGADSLVSMTLEEASEADSSIAMGNFCAAKLTLELINAPSSLNYDNLLIKAYSGLKTGDAEEPYEYVPLGLFYITETVTANNYKNLTITAYDGACRLEEAFPLRDDFPMTIEEFVTAAAEEQNLALSPDNVYLPYLLPQALEGYTYRQMLGFAAGLMGQNVRFDRLGRLQFYWYDFAAQPLTVERSQQYLNQYQPKTAGPLTVTGLSCICGEQTLTRGQGTAGAVLIMENPYMTESVLDDIWREKIADMDTAEVEGAVTVTYDGTTDETALFTAIYNQSLDAFRTTALPEVTVGSLLQMRCTVEGIDYTETLLVSQLDEENSQFAFSREESEEESEELQLPDGLSVTMAPIGQWKFTEASETIAEGDALYADEGTAVTVIHIDSEKQEMYLQDAAGGQLLGMEPGTEMTLEKLKITDYQVQYQPAELKWRGNPALQAGDVILAETAEGGSDLLLVMNQVLRFSGGLYSQITSYGQTERSAVFSSQGDGPTDKKLQRVYTSLQETILAATEKITGQRGGHVVINENENGPCEILIMDTGDIRTAKKVWRWNQGGLGYSSSGYEGPYATAVTQDGEIVGSFIQAESIAGSKLTVDSQTIEKIISGINAGEQKISSAVLEIDSEDLSEAIKMQVSETGGFNKISNSAGAFGTSGWICTGDVQVKNGTEEKSALASGSAFVLPAGAAMETDAAAAPLYLNGGKHYTLSVFVRENDALGSLVLTMGEQVLASLEAGGSGGGWKQYTAGFDIADSLPGGSCSLRISSVNGQFTVGDLFLGEGIQTAWSPYPGEVSGASMSMSQFGISITQENAKTRTIIDAAGTRVVSIENGNSQAEDNVVAEYTKDGVEAKSLIAREQVAAGRVRMIALDDRQMAAWIINNDTEVDL